MGPKLLHFIKYNNAVSIGVALLFLSFSGALAASPAVRSDVASAVLSQQQTVRGVDNSYIINKDLSTYVPTIQITGVTEDADNYYVAYNISTIDVVDYVWQDTVEPKVMQVAKAQLNGEDLGLYVTDKLKDVMDWQVAYLKRVQALEKAKGAQQAVVATAYSGLIGKFLDPKEAVLPGYTPVVPPNEPTAASDVPESSSPSSAANTSASVSSPNGPQFQILGNNPAEVPVGASYIDLGAVVTDPVQSNIGYHSSGADLVDTSKPATFTITYTATDAAGNTATATRTVIVYDPATGPPAVQMSAPTPPPAPSAPPPDQTTTSSLSSSPSSSSAGASDTTTSSTATADTSSSTPSTSSNTTVDTLSSTSTSATDTSATNTSTSATSTADIGSTSTTTADTSTVNASTATTTTADTTSSGGATTTTTTATTTDTGSATSTTP